MLWNRERRQNDQWENSFNYASMKWCGSKPEWSSASDSKLVCSFSKGKKKKKGTTALKKIALAGVPQNGLSFTYFTPGCFLFFALTDHQIITPAPDDLSSSQVQPSRPEQHERISELVGLSDCKVTLLLIFDYYLMWLLSPRSHQQGMPREHSWHLSKPGFYPPT